MSILNYDYEFLSKFRIGFEFEFFSEKSYQKIVELLNLELAPIAVKPMKKYHSNYQTSERIFKIEPDFSGGYNMMELVTHHFNYYEARPILIKVLKFIQKHGYTNEKCAMQFTLSIDSEIGSEILDKSKALKFILNYDEEEVYRRFPERRNNIYTQSIKKIIPLKDHIFNYNMISSIINSLEIPDQKYFGVNFTKEDKWEVRYIGGMGYESKIDQILSIIDYTLKTVDKSVNPIWSDKEIETLKTILTKNTIRYRNFSDYDFVKSNYPHLTIMVDTYRNYELIQTFYPFFWKRIYDIIKNMEYVPKMMINYDSDNKNLEIVNANIEIVFEIENVIFINSQIKNGLIIRCEMINSEVENSYIYKSKIFDTIVKKSKLVGVYTDYESEIYDSFFTSGYLNCMIEGGVVRNSKVRNPDSISSNTQLKRDQSYFRRVIGMNFEKS